MNMSLLLDIFYFIAWPISLCAIVKVIISRKFRLSFLLLSVAVVICWFFTMQNREARFKYFETVRPKSATELKNSIGSPERIFIFPEGDEIWTYSVWSYPWSRVQWYDVYKDRVTSSSSQNSIGFFAVKYGYIRDSKESEYARKINTALDQLK